MYRNREKVASVFDAHSVSNRKDENAFSLSSLSESENDQLTAVIMKTAEGIESGHEKEAFFSNGLQLFSQTRKVIADKLGISEDAAQDLTSNVLNKADVIHNQYGGDQTLIVNGIVEELQGQVAANPSLIPGDVSIHPMRYNEKKATEDKVKEKLQSHFGFANTDVEKYKRMVMKTAQDLVVILRPHKRDDIACAIAEVVCETGDISNLYGLKDSEILIDAVRSSL